MRKHHTRKPGRPSVASRRRPVAGLLAGAAAASSLIVAQPGFLAGPAATAASVAAAPQRLPLGRVTLTSATPGPLWLVNGAGSITSPLNSPNYGFPTVRLNAPIVAAAPTADGAGYWLVGSDGGVFTYGDAGYYGSTGGIHLNQPIVGMAPTPDGRGYWLAAADGGVFTFGDAHFYGSTGGIHLNKPITAMAATPSGGGYWLLGSDGGVFTFGDAGYHGSLGSNPPPAPVRDFVADPAGGYWMVTTTGTVYSFGPVGERPPMIVPTYEAPNAGLTQAQVAVAFAEAQIGKPYVWGATGPDSYDCSGLTQASWAAAGVAIPRTAAEQYDAGVHVPVADAEPGDLLFYSSSSSPADIYHVGIAMGDGLILHAPHSGTTVQIDPIWPGIFPWATRP